jgi:hypothetical protein
MKVPGVSARFGTDPFIWNWAMWLVARLCPRQFLQDRSQVCVQLCVRAWVWVWLQLEAARLRPMQFELQEFLCSSCRTAARCV